MMDALRTAANSLALKIILGLIALSFVLGSMSGTLFGGGNYAAKVNGQSISNAEFEQAYRNEYNRLQQQLGDQFSLLTENPAAVKQLRQQVLSQLVDNLLIEQYSNDLKLTVSNDDIKQAITELPYFQSEGQFDNAKYIEVLRGNGIAADQFAEMMRSQLKNQQLSEFYAASGIVVPNDSERMSKLLLQQRDVRLATIAVDKLAAKQSVTDDELKAYFDGHKAQFIAPEEIKVQYIAMSSDDFMKKTTVSDAEAKAYYEQHKAEFGDAGEMRFSLIQTANETEAKAVIDALKQGADFAALAKEKSQDVISAKNGGDMGWLSELALPQEIKAANLTEKGQVSSAIKAGDSYLVVRLTDVKAGKVASFEKSKKAIIAQLKEEKALDAYYAHQSAVRDAAVNNTESLASAEQAGKVKAVETKWFTKATIPAALSESIIANEIFNGSLLPANENAPSTNSDLITVDNDHSMIVRVVGHKPEAQKSFDSVKGEITTLVKRNKAVQQANEQANNLLVALKSEKGTAAMKAENLTFGKVTPVTRQTEDRYLVETVFAMAAPKESVPSYTLSSDQHGNVVIVALDKVIEGTMKPQEEKALAEKMLNGTASMAYDALLTQLRLDASVKMGQALN